MLLSEKMVEDTKKVLMRRCGENTWGNKIHVKLVKQTVVGVVGGFLFVFGI